MSGRTSRPRSSEGALAAQLRLIGEHIQNWDYDLALAAAEQILDDSASTLTVPQQSRVLAMVGDSEFKRGRYAEAAAIYLQAATQSNVHSAFWLRPLLGCVRAMLKIPQVTGTGGALDIAWQAVGVGTAKMAAFDEEVRLAKQELATTGSAWVPPLPPRVSVVATRLGYLFLQEGEPEAAEQFFRAAIGVDENNELRKNNACRARQGLAMLELARGNFEAALELATESIRFGFYRAKTLSSWPLVIAARRRLDGWYISERLINGLYSLDPAHAAVRARAILVIVRELRKNDMRQWRSVADEWLNVEGEEFPRIAKEIRKMILASAKAEPGNSTAIREAAAELLQMPELGPNEWIMAAKELVRTSLLDNVTIDVPALVTAGEEKYMGDIGRRIRHCLALSCMMANDYTTAESLLNVNVQTCEQGSPSWGRSVWALARMKSLLNAHADAADLYNAFYQADKLPQRLRLRARLLRSESLLQLGAGDPVAARADLNQALADEQDPVLLMDLARQMRTGPEHLRSMGAELFEQGKDLALAQFAAETHPSAAVEILFRLTRRQVYDFQQYAAAVEVWEGLTDDKREWLWTTRSAFWQYLGFLTLAYTHAASVAATQEFIDSWLEDIATPPEGWAEIGIPAGKWLIRQDRVEEALEIFAQVIQKAPTHVQAATAWYWKALQAHKQGEATERDRCCRALRVAQGASLGLLNLWELDARALLMLAGLRASLVDPQAVNYTDDFLRSQLNQINLDLEVLS